MRTEEVTASIRSAIQDIQKQFGRGAIMLLGGDEPVDRPVATFSSGSTRVDLALGIRGLPRGRIVEMFGPESSGKTTLALHALASVQRAGGTAAFVDAEHALDPRWARTIGVDLDRLWVSQPDCGEQGLEIAETLVKSGGVDLVVVDSVAALTPKAEIEGEMGDSHVGLHARLMSQAMRKLTGHAARSGCTLIFINQVRHKIGVMFGSPETTTGGNALKFYCSIRLDIRRIGAVKTADEVVGSRVRVKVVKNKLAPPFREAEFDILYGKGICRVSELFDLAVERKLIEKSGAWYAVGAHRMGQGREKARDWLAARPAVVTALEQAVLHDAPFDPGALDMNPAAADEQGAEPAASDRSGKPGDGTEPSAA
mgnify:CR=1 FL=1|jgi:recombination protein RecA